MNCKRQSQSLIREYSPAATAVLAMAIILVLTFISVPPAQAQTYQVIYNFTGGPDGAYPEAGLAARGGVFYGTAYQGGGSNRGTVFKLARNGSGWIFSPLYSFTGRADGSAPIAAVVFGHDGTIYGTTEFGGHNCGVGCGTVFHLRPPATICKSILCFWTETVLYQFSGSSDGANPGYGQLTFDQAGNVYGTTFFGGVNAQGVVYELTPSGGGWTERAIHTFSGSSDGENPYSSVVLDAAGNLYGTTYAGGAHGYGTVFQLTPSGSGGRQLENCPIPVSATGIRRAVEVAGCIEDDAAVGIFAIAGAAESVNRALRPAAPRGRQFIHNTLSVHAPEEGCTVDIARLIECELTISRIGAVTGSTELVEHGFRPEAENAFADCRWRPQVEHRATAYAAIVASEFGGAVNRPVVTEHDCGDGSASVRPSGKTVKRAKDPPRAVAGQLENGAAIGAATLIRRAVEDASARG